MKLALIHHLPIKTGSSRVRSYHRLSQRGKIRAWVSWYSAASDGDSWASAAEHYAQVRRGGLIEPDAGGLGNEMKRARSGEPLVGISEREIGAASAQNCCSRRSSSGSYRAQQGGRKSSFFRRREASTYAARWRIPLRRVVAYPAFSTFLVPEISRRNKHPLRMRLVRLVEESATYRRYLKLPRPIARISAHTSRAIEILRPARYNM